MIEGQVEGTHGQTTGGQGRIRAAVAHPWARELAVLVAFLAAGAAATWPLPSYITGRLLLSRDVSIYAWNLWWVAHQIIHLHDPWSTTYLAAPVGLPGRDQRDSFPRIVAQPAAYLDRAVAQVGPGEASEPLPVVPASCQCDQDFALKLPVTPDLRHLAGRLAIRIRARIHTACTPSRQVIFLPASRLRAR